MLGNLEKEERKNNLHLFDNNKNIIYNKGGIKSKMNEDFLKGITETIATKIGEENAGIIADDIGKLITANKETIDNIDSLNKQVASLKETNEKLIAANGSLLQQIPAVADFDKHQSEEVTEEKKAFNFKDAFDKSGYFKD